MKNWYEIREMIKEILPQYHYEDGTPCFLTAYQLAVLVNEKDKTLKGDLELGGKGIGEYRSFAQQIAMHLSHDIKNDTFGSKLEVQFLSFTQMDVIFGSSIEPSVPYTSMFRLVDESKVDS